MAENLLAVWVHDGTETTTKMVILTMPHLVVKADAARVGGKDSIGQQLPGVCDERLWQRRPRQDCGRARIAHAGHKHQLALGLQSPQQRICLRSRIAAHACIW